MIWAFMTARQIITKTLKFTRRIYEAEFGLYSVCIYVQLIVA